MSLGRKVAAAALLLAVGFVGGVVATYLTQGRLGFHSERPAQVARPQQAPRAPTNVRTEKFEGVYKAAKALSAATEVGVNRVEFKQLLSTFTAQLSILEDEALTPEETLLLRGYKDVENIYRACNEMWDSTRAGDSLFWNNLFGSRETVVTAKEAQRICKEHDLTRACEEWVKLFYKSLSLQSSGVINFPAFRSFLWATARERLDLVNREFVSERRKTKTGVR
jgi:hypothetical protein